MPKKKEVMREVTKEIEEKKIDFFQIEKKWQNEWEKHKIFQVSEVKGKKKFYVLEMFPYPSGEGLHMGHTRNYAIGDTIARFKRMQGFNVLYPMGYDSFGLPAENAAIAHKADPEKWTLNNIKLMENQQRQLGFSYDWTRKIVTCLPDYYKWNQWLFLQMFKKGLVYKKKSEVNFCPKCQTVLANEQVHQGKCWRHEDTDVEVKHLEQWFFKITSYAEELLQGLNKLDWPEQVKTMQENWIGKSHGININFKINGKIWPIFTTRPDTIYGVTFMVISAQHPKLMEIVTEKQKPEVEKFLKKVRLTRPEELGTLAKEGVFTGSYAINPINQERIPVYVGNFVLAEYGSGMVMAVPAHDQRDFEFAKKYNLPIRIVIQPKEKSKKLDEKTMKEAFVEEGILVNSEKFNGLDSKVAIEKISDYIEKQKLGNKTINYKIKDWLISRQRYWGTPIPIVYCEKCGIVPVPESELPVLLPESSQVKFGKGNPLETSKEFIETTCPKCKGKARRETDTMDTFVDSSWYFLRYCDPQNSKEIFNKDKIAYWMPVDFYVGGIEHATGHLIYSRFMTKVLRDLGIIKFDEPFRKLLCQGMVTLGGVAMSKSRGNVVDPLDVIKKFNVDTCRIFILFAALPEKQLEWSEHGAEGIYKFLNKFYNLSTNKKNKIKSESNNKDALILSKLQNLIQQTTQDIENYRLSLAITNIIAFTELLDKNKKNLSTKAFNKTIETLVLLLAPFAPHLVEELWHRLGNKTFVSLEKWPKVNKALINEEIEKQQETVEKLKGDIKHIIKIIAKKPKKIYIYAIPGELGIYQSSREELEQEFLCKVEIYANNDKNRYDPQKKAQKAKPGKPALYVE